MWTPSTLGNELAASKITLVHCAWARSHGFISLSRGHLALLGMCYSQTYRLNDNNLSSNDHDDQMKYPFIIAI